MQRRALPLGVEPPLEADQHHAVGEAVATFAGGVDGRGLDPSGLREAEIGLGGIEHARRDRIGRYVGRGGQTEEEREQHHGINRCRISGTALASSAVTIVAK